LAGNLDTGQLLSWIVGAVGITGFLLAGRKVWWAWYINLACQALWYAYSIATGQPAFFVTATFYTAVFGYNAWKWTKEHKRYGTIKPKRVK
jgi:hypothetical protein